MSLAQHIVIRPADNRPLFTNLEARTGFTQAIVAVGKPFEVPAWGAGDCHGHLISMGERTLAGELARRVELSLTRRLRLDVGFCPVSIKPIEDQSYLRSSIPYAMRQNDRHNVPCDPYHEGSSLPDALGLRLLAPDLPALLARVAPRLDLVPMLGGLGPRPAADDVETLAPAAAAAIGRPNLYGKGRATRAARRAVIELAPDASAAQLRDALGCSQRTLGRLRRLPPAPRPLIDAVIGQARWRNR
jgi:hypothetical protein